MPTADSTVFLDAPEDGALGEPAVAAPPASPALSPCPDGWVTTELGGPGSPTFQVCDPWPGGVLGVCDADQARLPGEGACGATGGACAPRFGSPPAGAGEVVHVDAAAAADGDGSVARPFNRLELALDGRGRGDAVLLSPGSYRGPFSIPPGVTIVGACPRSTRMTASPGEIAVQLAEGASLAELTVVGGTVGVFVAASAELRDVVVLDSLQLGVLVDAGGRLKARGLVVRTEPDVGGVGIQVVAGGGLDLARADVRGQREANLLVSGAGARAELADSVLGALVSDEGQFSSGSGGLAKDGAFLSLERVALDLTTDRALRATGDGTRLEARDLSVVSTAPLDETAATAIAASGGAEVVVERAFVVGTQGTAFHAEGGGEIHVSDAAVLGALARRSPVQGLWAAGGGTLTAARVWIAGVEGHGALVEGEGSVIELREVVVQDGLEVSDEGGERVAGLGVLARASGALVAERLLVLRARRAGVAATSGARLDVADLVVDGTLPSATEPHSGGFGFAILSGASGDLVRAEVRGSRSVGLLVAGNGSRLAAVELRIEDTAPTGCLAAPCEALAGGTGLAVYDEARAEVESFALGRNAMCGAQVARQAELHLRRGRIWGHPHGLCGADGTTASDDLEAVRFEDNDQDRSSTPRALTLAELSI